MFFCGSLEPGKDGVGDYTRRLAAELSGQGHTVSLIALNDPHISRFHNEKQALENKELNVTRFPAGYPMSASSSKLKQLIAEFNPSILSLQFVPFAFQPKGLPTKWISFLKSVSKGNRWHIMFHELWVGMDKADPMKAVAWGWLQKLVIRSLLRKLKPVAIHTQTRLYASLLAKMDYVAELLPLFGNIPAVSPTKEYPKKSTDIIFILFGSIHHGAPVQSFAKDILRYNKKHGTTSILKFIGRCGAEQKTWESAWLAEGLQIENLGEQSSEIISAELHSASYGISTTPNALIEKSGSVAAMLEHHLPVISVSREWHPRGYEIKELPEHILQYSPGNLEIILKYKFERNNNERNLSVIAGDFASKISSLI